MKSEHESGNRFSTKSYDNKTSPCFAKWLKLFIEKKNKSKQRKGKSIRQEAFATKTMTPKPEIILKNQQLEEKGQNFPQIQKNSNKVKVFGTKSDPWQVTILIQKKLFTGT